MRQFIGPAFAAALLLPSHALAQSSGAAVLSHVYGDVLVDAGEGFVPAAGDLPLKLGDRVMVTKAGGAILSYGSGCSFPLASPSMTTIEETACTTTTQGRPGSPGAVFAATGLSMVGTLAAAGIGAAENDQLPVSP